MFRWENFSKGNLKELARSAGLRVTYAAEDLAERFGTPPTIEFVDASWPVLRDRWLDGTPESRKLVVSELRHRGLGDQSLKVSTKSGEMDYLRSCRLSPNLRDVVLAAFIAAGSGEDVPSEAVVGEQGPTEDLGLVAIETLFRKLMIDEEWALRRPRGFTWWSYRLAQHIDASELFTTPDGAVCSTVTVRTEVVRDVPPGNTDDVEVLLAAVNALESMSALVWNSDRGTVEEVANSDLCGDTFGIWIPLLSTAAVYQNTAAHSRSHSLAQAIGGTPAASNHPTSGLRPEMDDLLNGPERWAHDPGRLDSGFTGEFMQNLLAFANRFSFANGEDTNFTGEVAYSGNRTGVEVSMEGRPVLETALITVSTSEPHPELGSGSLLTMRLPISPGEDEIPHIVNELNRREASGSALCQLLGAWCQRGGSVAFVTFVPSVLAGPAVLENLYIDNAARALWAHSLLKAYDE